MVDAAKNSPARLNDSDSESAARFGYWFLLWLSRPPDFTDFSFYAIVSLFASRGSRADEWHNVTRIEKRQTNDWKENFSAAIFVLQAHQLNTRITLQHTKSQQAQARCSCSWLEQSDDARSRRREISIVSLAALCWWLNLWRMSQTCCAWGEKKFRIF